jgi:hypothetical protein
MVSYFYSIFKSSAVAITVAPSDANVVYVGMGEADMRSNISLVTECINRKRRKNVLWPIKRMQSLISKYIHDANIVFCSAMGNPFKSNPERGVYRSKDGGNWQH